MMRKILDLFICLSFCGVGVSCLFPNEKKVRLTHLDAVIEKEPQMVLDSLNKIGVEYKGAYGETKMYYLLCLADAQNKTFNKVLCPSKMLEVSKFYETNGMEKDKQRAYYLLGCSFRDWGESPSAIEAFGKALTVSSEEKEPLLQARIYGQMADVFVKQRLPYRALKSLRTAYELSMQAKDTLSAAIFLGSCSSCYEMLSDNKSLLKVCSEARQLLLNMRQIKMAAMYGCTMSVAFLKEKQLEKARECLVFYEREAGVFDKNGNVNKGLEMYYFDKGEYFLCVNQLDSAEYYFRKTLTNREDGDCQEAGHRGLYLLYKKVGNKDSLAKYADLAYQINNKRILDLSSREIQNMQQLYNYTRNQEIAKQEQKRSGRLTNWIIGLLLGLVVCILAIGLYYNKVKTKRKLERREYEKKLESLIVAKQKQKLLLDNQIERMTEETNRQIEVLSGQLAAYQDEKNMSDTQRKEDELQASVICQKFHQVGAGLESLDQDDWKELETLLFTEYPSFKTKMTANRQNMMPDDYQVCLLSRLSFAPYEIGNILNLKSSNVTMKRKRLLKILFDKEGNAKTFDKLLQTLS